MNINNNKSANELQHKQMNINNNKGANEYQQ